MTPTFLKTGNVTANLCADAGGNVGVDLFEDGQLTFLDLLLLATAEVARDVVNEASLGAVIKHLLPERARLFVIQLVVHLREEVFDARSGPGVVCDRDGGALRVLQGLDRGLVVGSRTLVSVHAHEPVALEVCDGDKRRVDGDLLVVDTETVAVGVGVGEKTALENWVRAGLDTGHEVRRCESDLLDLGKVVFGVLVEHDLADWAERELVMRPDLGQVKHGVTEVLGLLLAHDLHGHGPAGVLALFNLLKQLLVVDVWVLARELDTLFLGVEAGALVGADVDLNVVPLALVVDELEGVARVAVLFVVATRDTAVAEEDHDLVDGLGLCG